MTHPPIDELRLGLRQQSGCGCRTRRRSARHSRRACTRRPVTEFAATAHISRCVVTVSRKALTAPNVSPLMPMPLVTSPLTVQATVNITTMKSLCLFIIVFLIANIIHVDGKRGNEVAERIEYTPGSGQRILFPDAELQLCDVPCETRNVSIQLSMVTNHIGKGCDRDTYSVESQRKLCGASAESVDLLPSPGIGSEWTRELRTDQGRESDQIYEFDGSTTAVVVPEATLNHSLSQKFSISLWMKHEDQGKKKHAKEAILCSSDDHKKNRHHYSLFVRNCRLILLVRQEHGDENHVVFKPAEWRWKLPQVCDNEWHHYSVSMEFPEASLFVDGQPLIGSQSGVEVIDDWPLHTVRGLRTTVAIGACWQGRESQMNSHFRGFLAGLSLLRGRTENPSVLSCLHRCQEGLQVPPADSVDAGTRLVVNSEASAVSIAGRDAIDVEDLLSQVSYQNSREFPTPGRRSLRLLTFVTCSDGKAIQVPNSHSYVVVLPPEQPSISLNGTANLAREYESFMQGIELFSTVVVQVNHEADQDDDDDGDDSRNDISDSADQTSAKTADHKLDACNVRVYPPLNADYESLRLPVNYMQHLGVHYKETKDGLVIHGADTVRSYQTILRQIVYFNRKPAYYLNRSFKLSCSELNGRFTSNDYIQTLTVIHPSGRTTGKEDVAVTVTEPVTTVKAHIRPQEVVPQTAGARAQLHEHNVEVKDSRLKSLSSGGFVDPSLVLSDTISRPSAMNSHVSPIVVGHAVTVIIVVCVGFLVFMVVLGVIRIRAAHHRTSESRDEEQEMAWDDTALTITVNPLDHIEQEGTGGDVHEEEEDSDSSGTASYREDGESSEEDEAEEVPKHKGMTWDDSAINY